MKAGTAIAILGLGLGALVVRAARGTSLRDEGTSTLRERAIEAQHVAAVAAARARALAAQSAEEDQRGS